MATIDEPMPIERYFTLHTSPLRAVLPRTGT